MLRSLFPREELYKFFSIQFAWYLLNVECNNLLEVKLLFNKVVWLSFDVANIE